MQKFTPFGENVLVESIVIDSSIYTPNNVDQTDGIILASEYPELPKGTKIHFTKTVGRLSETVRVVATENIIAVEE